VILSTGCAQHACPTRGGELAVAIMLRDDDHSDVQIASREDVQRFVAESLNSLGVSFDELARQAARGRFSSDRARRVWIAIHAVARPSA
jgi:hypothetical protein